MFKASAFMVALLFATPLAQAESHYLAVGPGGQRMFSPDGLHWEKHTAWGEPKHDQNDLNVATFFRGIAFAGGGYFSGRLAATRDGVRWSEGVLPKSSPIFGFEELHGSLYAITLRGQVYQTNDGSDWKLVATAEMPSKTHWIRRTAVGNGVIVGSGDFGPAMMFDPKSNNIVVTLMAGQTEKNATWKRVAFGAGVFVVSGQDGLLATSVDGMTWRNNETHPERGNITSVCWMGDRFLAVSDKQSRWESVDGLSWKENATSTPKSLVRSGAYVYGWSWPPHKLQRTLDGQSWEPVPNPQQYYVKDIAVGEFATRGEPPPLPPRE
jgi:hypothetical protein